MSILDGATQVMKINAETQGFYDDIRECEEQGHKFIELRLKGRSMEMLSPIMDYRFKYIKGLHVERQAVGNTGNLKVQIVEHADELIFRLDPLKRGHFAYMWDDPTGYNRNFLASHVLNQDPTSFAFVIVNDAIKADVLSRVDGIRKQIAAKDKETQERNAPLSQTELDKISNEDIDAQIALLQSKKSAKAEANKAAAQAPAALAPTPEPEANPLGDEEEGEPAPTLSGSGLATMK
jgi:hypothetical protein